MARIGDYLMKINIIHDGIYEIEDFITQLEADTILSKIDGNWDYSDTKSWDQRLKKINPPLKELADIRERICNLFSSYSKINHIVQLQRFEVGGKMGIHRDKIPSNNVKFGTACYLNDNYEGGEVRYPDLGIIIKPKARSLLIHGGDVNHEVKEVLSGSDRYFLTTFVHRDEFNEPVFKGLE
jgi:hypothetical protein